MMIRKMAACLVCAPFAGCQKIVRLIKFLSEPGMRVKLQKAENYYLADQQKQMPNVDDELFFHIDEKNNSG